MSKGLEALKEIVFNYVQVFKNNENGKQMFMEDVHIIEKALKALEIIKDRLIVKDKGGYIQVVCEFSIPSKNKKYDLLKEVLLCSF